MPEKKTNNQLSKSKKKSKSDLFIRLRSGGIYAICVLTGSLLGNLATAIMLSVAAGICAYEFYYMLRRDAKLPNETLGILGAVAYPISLYFFSYQGIIVVTVILIICLLFWYVCWMPSRITDVCVSFFGAIYTGFLLCCMLAMRMTIANSVGEIWGGIFIVFLLTTVSVNDGFAYLFGRKFGKHRLSPHVSPKKSWEGFFAGAFFSTVIWLVLLIFPGIKIEIWQCLFFGFLCAWAGVVGDLVESRMKRNSGVKDSGNLMPGHGGLLDRVDSIFLVSLISSFLLYSFNCFVA